MSNNTEYIRLKNPENSTPRWKETFESLAAADLEPPKVRAFEDTFEEFFECENVERRAAFFAHWQSASDLGDEHLTKVATMLSDHLDYLKHRTNNAVAEVLDGRIQRIEARAGGYRRFQSFRTAVLFHLGKLDLSHRKAYRASLWAIAYNKIERAISIGSKIGRDI